MAHSSFINYFNKLFAYYNSWGKKYKLHVFKILYEVNLEKNIAVAKY